MMGKRGVPGSGSKGQPTTARPIGFGAPGENRGFVVTITGYSPYQEIVNLLDPMGAQDDANKWGLVTRLAHLDSMFDGNSPFELYAKTDKQHFSLQTGEVDLSAQMPGGIGVIKETDTGDRMLIDPMTKEVISKQARVDENSKKETGRQGNPVYQANDHWFVLNLKLKWKDAPAEAVGVASKDKVVTKPKAAVTPSKPASSSKSGSGSKSKGGTAKKEPAEF
jgi:hypothetical protein